VSGALWSLVEPARTALVTQECQNGVIGTSAALRDLADEARRRALPNIAALVKCAHGAGVQVLHCVAVRRADSKGSNRNAKLFASAQKLGVDILEGSPGSEVVPEIDRDAGDIVLSRLHGLGPMGGTDLDPVLRNLGITTIVGVGVSVNVAMIDLAMDAVNAGYQFVLPRDAVAGIPPAYAEAVIDNTLALVSTVVTTEELLRTWREGSGGRP
jgi:nicotinamidase-related amidase